MQPQPAIFTEHGEAANGFLYHRQHEFVPGRQRGTQHLARDVERDVEHLLGDRLVEFAGFACKRCRQRCEVRGLGFCVLPAFGQSGLVAFVMDFLDLRGSRQRYLCRARSGLVEAAHLPAFVRGELFFRDEGGGGHGLGARR